MSSGLVSFDLFACITWRVASETIQPPNHDVPGPLATGPLAREDASPRGHPAGLPTAGPPRSAPPNARGTRLPSPAAARVGPMPIPAALARVGPTTFRVGPLSVRRLYQNGNLTDSEGANAEWAHNQDGVQRDLPAAHAPSAGGRAKKGGAPVGTPPVQAYVSRT